MRVCARMQTGDGRGRAGGNGMDGSGQGDVEDLKGGSERRESVKYAGAGREGERDALGRGGDSEYDIGPMVAVSISSVYNVYTGGRGESLDPAGGGGTRRMTGTGTESPSGRPMRRMHGAATHRVEGAVWMASTEVAGREQRRSCEVW